ncbi:unnamed protein product [Amoebophrya sp. A25]|nr:unnamed protein product [Amoebophrya sp. A25]|eukprot:GSA25T00021837001.1
MLFSSSSLSSTSTIIVAQQTRTLDDLLGSWGSSTSRRATSRTSTSRNGSSFVSPPATTIDEMSLLSRRLRMCGEGGVSGAAEDVTSTTSGSSSTPPIPKAGFLHDGFCRSNNKDDICKHTVCARGNAAFLKTESSIWHERTADGAPISDAWRCMCPHRISEIMDLDGGARILIDRGASALSSSMHVDHGTLLAAAKHRRVRFTRSHGSCGQQDVKGSDAGGSESTERDAVEERATAPSSSSATTRDEGETGEGASSSGFIGGLFRGVTSSVGDAVESLGSLTIHYSQPWNWLEVLPWRWL